MNQKPADQYRGEAALLLSAFFFTANTISVRLASEWINSYALTGIRFIIGIGLGFLTLRILNKPFYIADRKIWAARGIVGSIAMIMYYAAISLAGSGRAALLAQTGPFFIALNARIFLKEKISPYTVNGMLISFAGVILIFGNSESVSMLGNLLALGVGFIRGISALLIKKASRNHHPVTIYMAACFFGLIILPASGIGRFELSLFSAGMAVLAGVLAFLAQIIMTWGFRYMSPVRAGLLLYASLPMTLAASYFILEESMNRNFLTGTAMVFTGLLIDWLGKNRKYRPK